MDSQEKQTPGKQACRKGVGYEPDYGCCPQCARAAGRVTQRVVEML
jgi:inorganic pyrophosphatase